MNDSLRLHTPPDQATMNMERPFDVNLGSNGGSKRDRCLDLRLLERMADRDASAVKELYKQYAGPIYSYALRVLGVVEDAEEVLQDTFARAWEKAANYDSSLASPFTWLYMIARGLCYDRLRRGRRRLRSVTPNDRPIAEPSVGPLVFQRAELERLSQALTLLPQPDRRAVEMAVFFEHTGSEIASLTEEPLGTVKTRIRRGLARLRQILQDHD